jgi:sugar phosphate isomerase/epimerase
MREAVEKTGLRIMGLHWLLAKTTGLHAASPDDAIRKKTVAHLIGLADLCKAFGGDIMVFGSPAQRSTPEGQSRADTVKRLTDTFAEVGKACKERGVYLCIEPLTPKETDVINNAAEAVAIIEQINNPFVRLHLDVKAMAAETKPAADVIRANGRYLKSFHSNDTNLLGPGMGSVDHKPIIAALKDIGYSGYVSVEVFDYTPGPDEIAKQSAKYLKSLLPKK